MGKASFCHLQDMSGQIQIYVSRDNLPEGVYNEQFKKWDIGDILGAEGVLFKTKVGELSARVDHIRLLTKALRPLPEKFHGIVDQEIKYRQRYLDLIMSEETRQTFLLRSKIVEYIRQFLIESGLSGSGNTHDASHSGWRDCQAVYHLSQRFGYGVILADRSGTVFKTSGGRWF